MKKNKLERLFNLAKRESVPQAGPDFESQVMHAIRREVSAKPVSLLDQLNALFPRIALAAAIVIILCITTDVVITNASGTDLASGVSSISEEWLFPTKGF